MTAKQRHPDDDASGGDGARSAGRLIPEAQVAVAAGPPRPRRVLTVKGGILASQDGQSVKLRKQCLRCGYKHTSMTTMPIRPGVNRAGFYCPKCKKGQKVEVHAVG